MDIEQKFIALETEFKSEKSNDDSMTFSGYGAYFNNVDSYGDVILPGAFKDNVSRAKKGEYPVMLSQHGMDDYTPVGVFTKIVEDEKGLYVEGKLRTRTWEDKLNIKRSVTEILVDRFELLGRKS